MSSACINKSRFQLIDVIIVISAIISGLLLSDYTILNSSLTNQANNLNNTKFNNQSVLIFNRVPKVGSETIWALIDQLAKVNNFSSYSDSNIAKQERKAENTFMTQKHERETYVKMLETPDNVTVPYSYVKHMNFLNFNEFNRTNPVYINFVRHPVERVISWYYYVRQGGY
jgi:hypothetical protein